jgi:hypothetical protein
MGKSRSPDKPKVNLTPVAGTYDAHDERTIEFSHANGGGLISFRAQPNGTLRVDIHNQDPTVNVTIGVARGGHA